ncbi:unnamed protein product, partial [Rotaria magnacalcarata]
MFKEAESYFTSIDLYAMTPKFWARSLFIKPTDRAVVCHAGSIDMEYYDDYRIKMCAEINNDYYCTIHHEMGHIEYYMSYDKRQPFAFQDGANSKLLEIQLQYLQHGLDRNNLERLRFYAVRRPEKLDKAFRYLCEKISRYLNNRNRPYVILGITVMNDIVKSCYQLLNTFVDDYLETLRLVLEERDDLELIEQAVASFESFCEIREEAPNYQRNYQFFVHRFTALCYYHDEMNKI